MDFVGKAIGGPYDGHSISFTRPAVTLGRPFWEPVQVPDYNTIPELNARYHWDHSLKQWDFDGYVF